MGKGKRLKGKRNDLGRGFVEAFSERLTANFQKQIRKSELWDQMVAEFGEKRAEELLRECKADVEPAGRGGDGSGDRTKDIP